MKIDDAIERLCAYGTPQDEEKFQEALDMGINALVAMFQIKESQEVEQAADILVGFITGVEE